MNPKVEDTTSNRTKSGAPIMFWLLAFNIYALFLLPATILNLYQDELNLSLFELIKFSLPVIVILTLAEFIFLRKLPCNIQKLVGIAFLLIILFALYNTYFNDYGDKVIDKDADVFDSAYHLLDYLILIGISTIFFLQRHKLKEYLSLAFSILLFTGFGNLIALTPAQSIDREQQPENHLLDPKFFSFSRNQNIIHIVLDAFQGSVFSEIIANDPSIAEPFQGFIFYPDALTSAPQSYLSFAAFFSGDAYQGIEPISEYQGRTGMLKIPEGEIGINPPILDSLKREGFDLDLLVNSGSHMHYRPDYRSYYFYKQLFRKSDPVQIGRLVDLTLIRILPWVGKRQVYRNGSWLFSADHENLPRANRAEKFMRNFANQINVDNENPTYKLIHLITPHQPWTSSHDCRPQPASNTKIASYNQANCIIKATALMLDDLKELPVYENSLIIVNGDHGNCYPGGLPGPGEDLPDCIGNANPLVLIKPPGNQGKLTANHNPVELTDLPATIANIFDLAYQDPGQSMMETESIKSQERNYFLFRPNSVEAFHLDRYTSVSRYTVRGSMFNRDSWSKEVIENPFQDIGNIPDGEVIRITKYGLSEDGKVFWVRWQGNSAKKYMYIEIEGERTPLSIRKDHFRIPVPKSNREKPIFLVDPLRNVKQEIYLQNQ